MSHGSPDPHQRQRELRAASHLGWCRNIGLLCWILKDLGWVIVFWPIAIPAGVVAIICAIKSLYIEATTAHASIWVHALAEFLWLSGNFVWMFGEMLYDQKPSKLMPWYTGPLYKERQGGYEIFASVTLCIFFTAITILILYYFSLAGCWYQQTDARYTVYPVFGFMSDHFYSRIFVGPWIAKDVFWNLEYIFPLVICQVLSIGIISDYVRRYSSCYYKAELLWVLANTTWSIAEVIYESNIKTETGPAGPNLWLRACAMFFLSCAAMQISCRLAPEEDAMDESETLLTSLTAPSVESTCISTTES